MRSIKLGLAVVAALAFSASMSASAFAITSFLAQLGKLALLSQNVEEQIFKTKAGKVECKEAKIVAGETGTANAEETSQLAEINYKSCFAFGFVPTTLKNADYLFLANGTVHIRNEVTIVGGGCEVKVPAQTIAAGVKFSNNASGKSVILEPKTKTTLYTAKSCPSGNGEFKDGEYTGNSEAMTVEGSLKFMP